MITEPAIREQTRQYIQESLNIPVGDGENLFAAGFVNSLFAMQLVTFVERSFGIEVGNEDLELTHFSSVDSITEFVVGKTIPAC
jgi:methoxymalonate biosynthesis acyl carrier protein